MMSQSGQQLGYHANTVWWFCDHSMGRIRDVASLIGIRVFHPRSEWGPLLIPTEQGFHTETDQNNLIPDPKRIIAFITFAENDRLWGKMPWYSKDWRIQGYPIERETRNIRVWIRDGTMSGSGSGNGRPRIRTSGQTVPEKGSRAIKMFCRRSQTLRATKRVLP